MEARKIWNNLMEYIGNPFGAAGVMGNLKKESALDEDNLQNSANKRFGITDEQYIEEVDSGKRTFIDSAGFGLAQWTSGGRKQSLLDHCRALGASIGDEDAQLSFLRWELENGYKAVLKKLRNATSVKEASDYFCKKFERPKDQSKSALNRRSLAGEAYYEMFKEREVPEVRIYKKGVKIQIAPNFKSTEFDCNGKGCCTETPIHDNLIMVLQKVRDHFGKSVKINSGYRCPVKNGSVPGASKNSQHMKGLAADIVVNKGKVHPMQVARYLEKVFNEKGIKGRIGCYTYDDKGSGFVHVDVRGTNSRAVYTENNTDYDNVTKFTVPIKRGAKGKIVKVVQRRLKSAKLYTGAIDGSCGGGTEKGIIAWNAKYGRPNDASWGPKCWQEAFPI